MRDIPVPWVNAAADAPLEEEAPDRCARSADAILAASRRVEGVSTPTFGARLLTRAPRLKYGPRAALAPWLVGVAWLVGSHFVGSGTVAQQDSMQTAGMGEAAQTMAAEPHAQNADVDAMRTAQSPDGFGVGSAKSLGPAKPEVNIALAEVSGKVPRRKSAEKPSEARDHFDRLGLEIAALLAADPASRSRSVAPVTRKGPQGRRGDAFDPSQNPTAPGALRPLGAIAPPAIDLAAQTASGRRTD